MSKKEKTVSAKDFDRLSRFTDLMEQQAKALSAAVSEISSVLSNSRTRGEILEISKEGQERMSKAFSVLNAETSRLDELTKGLIREQGIRGTLVFRGDSGLVSMEV